MSTALTTDMDGDYASQYVRSRVGGALPVRWSAIEVLKEGKYSRASDVWAFGCLVHEVMTRGSDPYPTIPTTMEVAEFVKAGRTMPCATGCPAQVREHTSRLLIIATKH